MPPLEKMEKPFSASTLPQGTVTTGAQPRELSPKTPERKPRKGGGNKGEKIILTSLLLSGLGAAGYEVWQNPPNQTIWRVRQTITEKYEQLFKALGIELHPVITNFDNKTAKGTLGLASFTKLPPEEIAKITSTPPLEESNTLSILFPLEFPNPLITTTFERQLTYNSFATPADVVQKAEERRIANLILMEAPVGTKIRLSIDGAYIKLSDKGRGFIAYPAPNGKIYLISIGLSEQSTGFTLYPLIDVVMGEKGQPLNLNDFRTWTPLLPNRDIFQVSESPKEKLVKTPVVGILIDVLNPDPQDPFVNLKIKTVDVAGQQKIVVASR